MLLLTRGTFYGDTNKTNSLEGITLTDTVYTHDKVDWHHHENAYFTFILEGAVIEGNKKETYTCTPGTLLYHNWQEPHYNIKPAGFTRGFHLEIDKDWRWLPDMSDPGLQGSLNITDPDIKLLMYRIFREQKIGDLQMATAVDALALEVLARLTDSKGHRKYNKPKWVDQLNQLLHDQLAEKLTLDYLSQAIDLHPSHLSRDFSKYFNCTLGEYMRKLKVEKALSLMSMPKSFTEIAYECGFFDQSHFTRCCREITGLSPSQHRKLLVK
ncbi:MAG: helix-turn-helix transcriptional regulator [Chitinophagaceae bacterium]